LLEAVWLGFALVFVAELGDKSQLLVVSLAARLPRLAVLAGVATAAALMQLVSVAAGALLADRLPERLLQVAAAVLFLAFAVWTLVSGPEDDDDEPVRSTGRSAYLVSASAFMLAELGDKTMLATIALASRADRVGVWIGTTAAMVLSAAIAVLVGGAVARRVPERVVRYAAAAAFAIVGVLLLVGVG
jgi:putative Ca2+/H+ antiporter (TMEM165/GDT1 family)